MISFFNSLWSNCVGCGGAPVRELYDDKNQKWICVCRDYPSCIDTDPVCPVALEDKDVLTF